MALLGKLAVAVVGDINQLKKSFKEVKAEAKSLDKEIQKSGFGIAQIAKTATIAGTAIVGAMGAMVLSTARAAEQIDLLAKRTGISREELQGLAYAAQQEGTNIEALSTGLARLSRYMMDTRDGTGEARRAFAELGISVTNADGTLRNSVDVLMQIADKMHGMTNETEMQALAIKTLGRSGTELVPFLRMGSDEIRRLMEEARRLGYVIDEESVIAMEAFGDELQAVRTGLAGLIRQIAADVLPYFRSFINVVKSALEFLHQFPEPIRKIITQGTLLAGVLALVAGGLSSIIIKAAATKAALAALHMSFTPFLIGGGVALGLGLIARLIDDIRKRTKALKGDVEDWSEAELESQLAVWQARLDKAKKELAKIEKETGVKYKKGGPEKLGPVYIGGILAEMEAAQQAINNLQTQLDKLRKSQPGVPTEEWNLADYLAGVKKELEAVDRLAKYTGDYSQVAANKAQIYRKALEELVSRGIDPTKTSLGNLVALWKKYDEQEAREQRIAQIQQETEVRHPLDLAMIEENRRREELAKRIEEENQAAEERIKQIQAETEVRNFLDLAMIEENRRREEYKQKFEEEKQAAEDRIKQIQSETEVRDMLDLAMIAEMRRREEQAERNAAAETKIAEARKYLDSITKKVLPEWEQYAQSLEELANSGIALDLADQLRELAAEIRKAGKEAGTWREALADMAEEALDWNQRMVAVATQTAKGIEGAFENFFFDAFTGQLNEAEDYWRAFTQSIARMLSQLLSQQLVYAFIRNLFPGLNFGLPGMAAGGPVTAGTAYLVGERGPELFVPATSGTIVPNDRVAVGTNVSVNLVNQSGVPLKATQQGEPFFDGRRAVVSLILEADDRNIGGLHDRLGRR